MVLRKGVLIFVFLRIPLHRSNIFPHSTCERTDLSPYSTPVCTAYRHSFLGIPPRLVAAPLSPRLLVRSTVVLGVRLSRQALGDLFDQVDVAVVDRVLSELAKRSWLTKYLIKLKPAAQRKGNLTLAVIGFLGDISAHFLSYRAHNCFYEPCSFHPRKAMLQRFIFVNL